MTMHCQCEFMLTGTFLRTQYASYMPLQFGRVYVCDTNLTYAFSKLCLVRNNVRIYIQHTAQIIQFFRDEKDKISELCMQLKSRVFLTMRTVFSCVSNFQAIHLTILDADGHKIVIGQMFRAVNMKKDSFTYILAKFIILRIAEMLIAEKHQKRSKSSEPHVKFLMHNELSKYKLKCPPNMMNRLKQSSKVVVLRPAHLYILICKMEDGQKHNTIST